MKAKARRAQPPSGSCFECDFCFETPYEIRGLRTKHKVPEQIPVLFTLSSRHQFVFSCRTRTARTFVHQTHSTPGEEVTVITDHPITTYPITAFLALQTLENKITLLSSPACQQIQQWIPWSDTVLSRPMARILDGPILSTSLKSRRSRRPSSWVTPQRLACW